MNCQRCGSPCDFGSYLCPRCLAQYRQQQAYGGGVAQPIAASQGLQVPRYAMAGVTCLVVLSAGLFAAKGVNIAQAAQSGKGKPLAQQGSVGGAELQQSQAAGGPTVEATSNATGVTELKIQGSAPAPTLAVASDLPSAPPLAQESNGMPPLVNSYLAHLQRIETMRQSLAHQELGNLTAMMTALQGANNQDASSSGEDGSQARAGQVASTTDGMATGWAKLRQEFNSVAPPADCAPLASTYDSMLGETITMMNDVMSLVGSAASDQQAALGKLTSLQGTSSGRIEPLARKAEQHLEQVFAKYKATQTFKIATDVGS